MKFVYQEPRELTAAEIDAALASGHSHEIIDVLWSLALYGDDADEAERMVRRFIGSEDVDVRMAAARVAGTIARIFGRLIDDLVASLRHLLSDPGVNGAASDALDDYTTFVDG